VGNENVPRSPSKFDTTNIDTTNDLDGEECVYSVQVCVVEVLALKGRRETAEATEHFVKDNSIPVLYKLHCHVWLLESIVIVLSGPLAHCLQVSEMRGGYRHVF
jgi:hypothetical protein